MTDMFYRLYPGVPGGPQYPRCNEDGTFERKQCSGNETDFLEGKSKFDTTSMIYSWRFYLVFTFQVIFIVQKKYTTIYRITPIIRTGPRIRYKTQPGIEFNYASWYQTKLTLLSIGVLLSAPQIRSVRIEIFTL